MINRDAWLGALRDAGLAPVDDDQSVTVQELAKVLGLKPTAARQRMRNLVEVGKAICTTKRVKDTQGRIQTIVAYRLKDAIPKKKGRAA